MKKIIASLFTLVLLVNSAFAHNGMRHVMGTVASIADNSITVTTADGKSQSIATTSATKYARMDTMMAAKDLRVGDHIVIHATMKDGKLNAATVKAGTHDGMVGHPAPR